MLVFQDMGQIRGRFAATVLLGVVASLAGLSLTPVQAVRGIGASREPAYRQDASTTVKGDEVTLSAAALGGGVLDGALALNDALGVGPNSTGSVTSPPVRAPLLFSHVGLRWPGPFDAGESIAFELRASRDGVFWTPWESVEQDDDLQVGKDGQALTRLLSLDPRGGLYQYAQARVNLSSQSSTNASTISSLSFSFIDPTAGPTTAQALQLAAAASSVVGPQAIGKPSVISRTAWGSPDGQGSPKWLPEYQTVTNIVVHHTDTPNNAVDWAAEVRAIWYYHAITNRWGDIGYNYMVDPNGNTYEGRAGGDDVVAGHALRYNWGSLGVAFLGDFATVAPSAAAQNSLMSLLTWKADQRGIDPVALNTYFVDRTLPSIFGHRDVLSTSCPGNYAYSLLPQIRSSVRDRLLATPTLATILGTTFAPTTLPSGNVLKVSVTVRNDGSSTIQTQDPSPGYVYDESETYLARASERYGRFRVGIDFNGRAGTIDHPYRWGLGKDLAPGEVATVVGYVRLNTLKRTDYWAGLVQEAVRWVSDRSGDTIVLVTSPDTTPPTLSIPAPARPSKSWFTVTWSGTDDISGRVPSFDVDYSTDNKTWSAWMVGNTTGSSLFEGVPGRSYYFQVQAKDAAGNVGEATSSPIVAGNDRSGLRKVWVTEVYNRASGGW